MNLKETNQQLSEKMNFDINDLVKAGIVPKDVPTSQVAIFAATCGKYNLNPVRSEIYLLPIGGKYCTFVGINGLRTVAQRTGVFAGVDNPKFDLRSDGTFKTMVDFTDGKMPLTCTITVYKIVSGIRCPFTATIASKEFKKGGMWSKMPLQMIVKCAESHALRKAFAGELNGLFIKEEQESIEIVEGVEPEEENIFKEKEKEIIKSIKNCKSIDELKSLKVKYTDIFKQSKEVVLLAKKVYTILNISDNG